jgi:hypothetical protein
VHERNFMHETKSTLPYIHCAKKKHYQGDRILRGVTQPKNPGLPIWVWILTVLQIQQIHAKIPTPFFIFFGSPHPFLFFGGFRICKSDLSTFMQIDGFLIPSQTATQYRRQAYFQTTHEKSILTTCYRYNLL